MKLRARPRRALGGRASTHPCRPRRPGRHRPWQRSSARPLSPGRGSPTPAGASPPAAGAAPCSRLARLSPPSSPRSPPAPRWPGRRAPAPDRPGRSPAAPARVAAASQLVVGGDDDRAQPPRGCGRDEARRRLASSFERSSSRADQNARPCSRADSPWSSTRKRGSIPAAAGWVLSRRRQKPWMVEMLAASVSRARRRRSRAPTVSPAAVASAALVRSAPRMRPRSWSAARSVNVNASIDPISTPSSTIAETKRSTRTRVLPVPAPASQKTSMPRWAMAADCSGVASLKAGSPLRPRRARPFRAPAGRSSATSRNSALPALRVPSHPAGRDAAGDPRGGHLGVGERLLEVLVREQVGVHR